MKTFFRVILMNIFMFTMPLFVLTLGFSRSGITPQLIKQELDASKTYFTMSQYINNQLTVSGGATDLIEAVKTQLTPDYLKAKTEKLIDDTYSWLNNQTSQTPTISFKDLKDNLSKNNPQIKQEFEVLEIQSKTVPEYPLQDKQFDIHTLIRNDYSYPVGDKMQSFKIGYQIYQYMLPVSGLLSLLSFIGILAMSEGIKSKLKWTWHTFFWTAILGFLPTWLGATAGWNSLINVLQSSTQIPLSILLFSQRIITLLYANTIILSKLATGIFLGLAAICFGLSLLIREPGEKVVEVHSPADPPFPPKPSSEEVTSG